MLKDIPGHPDKQLIYSSPSMHDRRSRLLKETRRLINERGFGGFSVRELCRRAGVAPRTLYNSFHDKDRLIGIAIREAYDEISNRLHFKSEFDTIESVLAKALAVSRGNLQARNYAQAIASIYFSLDTPKDLLIVLRDMAIRGMTDWFNAQKKKGHLEEWVIIEDVTADMANVEYALINDWCAGRLSDEDYPRRLIESILITVMAVTRESTSERARDILMTIRKTGTLPDLPKPVWRARDVEMSSNGAGIFARDPI